MDTNEPRLRVSLQLAVPTDHGTVTVQVAYDPSRFPDADSAREEAAEELRQIRVEVVHRLGSPARDASKLASPAVHPAVHAAAAVLAIAILVMTALRVFGVASP